MALERNLVVAAMALLVASCHHEVLANDEPPDRTSYRFVMGLVTDPNGVGVPAVAVRISGIYVGGIGSPQVDVGGCSGIRLVADTSIVSDAGGRFSSVLRNGPVNPPLCLGFELTPPASASLSPAVVTIRNISISGTKTVMDTTFLAVHLQRTAAERR